ncbi:MULTISPECIES: hypothetical protein [Clostridium]|uniref:Uncharacterized protein n=1 Tax=Clostridium botulinum TaxID=1491 RepID=A0A6M0SSH2_CLOBO|nr:hypothetical protein [Clostridium botulinum]MBY6809326.1 hypothetical protein [Clostridium botulinum]MBY6822768.1 hypothetical protein [Clostridium botulinum]MBY6833380.1 hypothetical protein [Clostridium botulinum]MBY6971441.1 hypothetical protein [Clostridium botulinum]NFA43719.1 hypothetical protein [Clostridium botulinum]
MGTSSIYNGKMDKNKLLPDDYDTNGEEENVAQKNISKVSWQTVKTNMSKYINSGGHSGSAKHIASQYVKASGGSGRLLNQSVSGMRTAGNIGNFLNGIKSEGIVTTLQKFGVDYTGKSVYEVFSELVSVVAFNSDSKEDIVAKEAALESLSKIYDYVEINNMELESLDSMPATLMNETLCEYVGSYIWIKMMNDLESRFEKYIDDPKEALGIEQEFRQYIFNTVRVEFENKGDIINQDVRSSIVTLYSKCLDVLEGTL